jgi:octaprenyl-diphosphate synthase
MRLQAHIHHDKLKGAYKVIDSELAGVQELIISYLRGDSSNGICDLISPVCDSVFSGKMIRPALVLLSGSACGKITDEHIRVAAIVEMIHNATLIHDDVIDEGFKRRGAATINKLWGNESAVLLGDFLLSRVFGACADLEPQTSRIIAEAAGRTCEGELRQIMQRQNRQLTESEYIDIITEKTAALFSCCCKLGALLAGVNQTQQRSFADFGLNVGIAFQITDDLLDIVGDEDKTGKTLGSDADKNKLTLPVIHLLNTQNESQKKAMTEKLGSNTGDKKAIAEELSRFGSLGYAEAKAQGFAAKAIESLADLNQSNAKSVLVEIVRFIANRAGIRCL